MSGIVVHEWIEQTGGSEYVLERICKTLAPSAVFCAWNNDPDRFEAWNVRESWLARTPLRGRKALAIPALMRQWGPATVSNAPWVLASSHAFAHHVPAPSTPGARKLGYIYTPARYVWYPETDQRGRSWPVRAASKLVQRVDRRRASELDEIAAISRHIAKRINLSWRRDASVIYPPVNVERFVSPPDLSDREQEIVAALPDNFILGASRFVSYKRLETAIRLGELAGLPVVLAGAGPDEKLLRDTASLASVSVTFVVSPSTPLLAAIYRKAFAFSFPVLEDFGIMPVEAMASGTPVIGLSEGGVSETVLDGVTGALIDDLSDRSLLGGLDKVRHIRAEDCVARAYDFAEDRFDSELRNWVEGDLV